MWDNKSGSEPAAQAREPRGTHNIPCLRCGLRTLKRHFAFSEISVVSPPLSSTLTDFVRCLSLVGFGWP
jgi:hypothetical protein